MKKIFLQIENTSYICKTKQKTKKTKKQKTMGTFKIKTQRSEMTIKTNQCLKKIIEMYLDCFETFEIHIPSNSGYMLAAEVKNGNVTIFTL